MPNTQQEKTLSSSGSIQFLFDATLKLSILASLVSTVSANATASPTAQPSTQPAAGTEKNSLIGGLTALGSAALFCCCMALRACARNYRGTPSTDETDKNAKKKAHKDHKKKRNKREDINGKKKQKEVIHQTKVGAPATLDPLDVHESSDRLNEIVVQVPPTSSATATIELAAVQRPVVESKPELQPPVEKVKRSHRRHHHARGHGKKSDKEENRSGKESKAAQSAPDLPAAAGASTHSRVSRLLQKGAPTGSTKTSSSSQKNKSKTGSAARPENPATALTLVATQPAVGTTAVGSRPGLKR